MSFNGNLKTMESGQGVKRSIMVDLTLDSPPKKRPTMSQPNMSSFGPRTGPASAIKKEKQGEFLKPKLPVSKPLGGYRIPKKNGYNSSKASIPSDPPCPISTFKAPTFDPQQFAAQEFEKTGVNRMKRAINSALGEVQDTGAHTLFICENPFRFLDEDYWRQAGVIFSKMDEYYRPQFLPQALNGIRSKGLKNVMITVTHNALMTFEENKRKKEVMPTNKRPLADVFQSLQKTVRSIVEAFGVEHVILIMPPSIEDNEVLSRLSLRFMEAITSDPFLSRHAYMSDFYSFSPNHGIKTTTDGMHQFLLDNVYLYAYERSQGRL